MRGFTDQEKEAIRQRLIEKGKEFFAVQGFKKTSIKELTDDVGIAQGSFYLFFQSKEELYFRILESEEEGIKQNLLQEFIFPMTADQFSTFLIKGIELVTMNPFIRRLYFEGELELIVRKLPKEMVETHIQKDTDLLFPLVQSIGIDEGRAEEISGAVRAFFLMSLHRKEIGEESYDLTIQFLARAIANEIFKGD